MIYIISNENITIILYYRTFIRLGTMQIYHNNVYMGCPVFFYFLQQEEDEITFPHQVKWTCGPDMPFGMSGYIQSVTIQETVYVGGGEAGSWSPKNYIVMAYNTRSCKWDQLPPYRAESFAMVVINNQLVLIGGTSHEYAAVKLLSRWDTDRRQWTHPYLPMLTARSSPSAVVYKQWLIVAGGWAFRQGLSAVEVFDVASNKWFSAPSTPTPWSCKRSTILGDIWYLMSDRQNVYDDDIVYSVSLPDLISHTLSSSSGTTHRDIWKKIPGLGYSFSTPLCMGGAVLAVGGMRVKDRAFVSIIHRYIPETEEWIEVGQLPSPLYNCTCTFTLDKKLLVIGGVPRSFVLHVGTLN